MANTKIPVELSSTPGIVDNSNATAITIDSSERVGIGTTSPSGALHVNAGTNNVGAIFESTDQEVLLALDDSLKTTTIESNNGILIFGTNGASGGTSATEAMRIDRNGNVGIGGSPSAPLTVNTGSDGNNVYIDNNGTQLAIGSTSSVNYINSQNGSAALAIQTNGTERMRIDSSGNVGFTGQLYSTNAIGTLGGFKFFRNHANGDCFVFDTTTAPYAGDLIFGTTNTERMRIDSSGNVGIGQTSPYSHSSFSSLSLGGTSGKGGLIQLKHTNDAAKGYLYAQSDAITLESVSTDIIRFVTNAAERARLDTSGRLLLGITSASGAGASVDINGIEFGPGYINIHRDDTAQIKSITFGKNGSEAGNITTTSQTFYNSASDYRLKENVDYDFNALDRVAQLKPARFNFIVDADTTVDGFIAHEVQDIVPEAVTGEKDAEEMQCIDQSKLVPLLTKAIQEQQAQIDALQSEINELKNS